MSIAKKLNIKEFPFEIKDSRGNIIYYEEEGFNGEIGYWERYEYDSEGNEIWYESLIEAGGNRNADQ
jgi:hypothetical protein